MSPAKDAIGEAQLILDKGINVLAQIEATLAILHFAAQVGTSVEPKAIVCAVEILQPVNQGSSAVLVVSKNLARLAS